MAALFHRSGAISATLMLALVAGTALAQPPAPPAAPGAEEKEKLDFPPFKEVGKDYEKVVSFSEEGREPFYERSGRADKDQSVLAELPRGFQNQKHYWAMTVSSGDTWAGLQGNTVVAYWRRYDKSIIALVQPSLRRSTGDEESKQGVNQQFSDRVLLDVPIKCMGPGGQPMIDLKALLAGQAGRFFGGRMGAKSGARNHLQRGQGLPGQHRNFDRNVQIASGQLRTFPLLHQPTPPGQGFTGYKPREADDRIGYFTTSFRDLGKFRDDKKWVRYINRWNIEKRDPNLALSPPKTPIIYYIDSKVPVRYRRYVREGILAWNKAFEKVGIADAIEVYYQDQATGANMEKDCEDVRYNFIRRWLRPTTRERPSVLPPTRAPARSSTPTSSSPTAGSATSGTRPTSSSPETAMTGMSAETISFLDKNPNWDPRVRLADPGQRDYILAQHRRPRRPPIPAAAPPAMMPPAMATAPPSSASPIPSTGSASPPAARAWTWP